ncbi:hypothetical protein K2173_003987 [Erythroxylum novogranatense]|uniref:Tetraspanin-8 n=1 Tax=Erythroxylum novogranatense TaxID=1862640 RepID=A0AAV8SJ99_9ROSI|nr:hypothetical protein K2173_003987 [Erythroxylum novogranatense]
MFRISTCLFYILNAILMILGFIAICYSLFLRLLGTSDCQNALKNPLLIMGVFLFVVALVGFLGTCCKVTLVLWFYSLVMFIFVLGLIAFMVFAFVVTHKGAGETLAGIGYKEHRLGDYSNWLQNHFVDGKHWFEIRSCLINAEVCKSLGEGFDQDVAQFYQKKLSSLLSGCCKPPTYCGLEYKNATFWLMPPTGPAVTDPDCTTWKNEQNILCYDCNSCKAGILDNIRKEWRALAIANACITAFVIIVYSISCCTRRNIKYNAHKYYYKSQYIPN